MRIAIPLADGKLAMHFGHCEKFTLFEVDTEGKKILRSRQIDPPPHVPGLFPRWLNEQGVNHVIAVAWEDVPKASSRSRELMSLSAHPPNHPIASLEVTSTALCSRARTLVTTEWKGGVP